MTIQEILNTIEHRPWIVPEGRWKFYQEWNNVIFLHWEVELAEVEKFVPQELEIDYFDGKPWVSVVAFTMEGIRPRNFPSFPPISNFDEINIRTYVKLNEKTGVYFLSIEGGKFLSCKVAKAVSGLPYRFSNMKRAENHFVSNNSEFKDKLDVEYTIGTELKTKTKLEKWLTERYALYQDSASSINEFEIHHLEWPINEIDIKKAELNYQRFDKLIRHAPTKALYSKGVKVIAWDRNIGQKIGRSNV